MKITKLIILSTLGTGALLHGITALPATLRSAVELINHDTMPVIVTIQSGPFTEQIQLSRSGGRTVLQLSPSALITISGSGVGKKHFSTHELSPKAVISTFSFYTPERTRHLQITRKPTQG